MHRHRFDPVSAVSGAAFVLIAASAVFGDSSLSLLERGRVWAMLLLLGGVALLAVAVRRPEPTPSVFHTAPPPELLVQAASAASVDGATEPGSDAPPFLTDAERAIEELRAMSSDSSARSARTEEHAASADRVNLGDAPSDGEDEGPDGV